MSDKLGRPDGFVPHAYVDEDGISYGVKQTANAPHFVIANIDDFRRLIDAILLNPTIDMATYRTRTTTLLETGTNSVGNIGTVATVTAMSGVGTTNILQAQDMVLGANLSAWALCCRERIS